jgi:hypothetical protein
MKKDDIVAVDISGQKVQDGKVKSVDWENGQVTIVIPATEVVMAFRTQLDPAATAPKSETTHHAILGTEQSSPESAVVPPAPEVSETVTPVAPVEAVTPPPAPVENNTETPVPNQSEEVTGAVAE